LRSGSGHKQVRPYIALQIIAAAAVETAFRALDYKNRIVTSQTFQRLGSISNAHVGRSFEDEVKFFFEARNLTLIKKSKLPTLHPKDVEIGSLMKRREPLNV